MKNLRFVAFLFVIIAVLALTGCFLFGRGPLEIVFISPALDGTGVLIDAVITIQASADLDTDTVTVDSVQLTQSGQPVAAAVVVTDQTITVTPDALLDFGTEYTLTIAGSVADTRGNTLEGEVSGSFTTRFLTVSVSSTGGIMQSGAAVTVDGVPAGTTDSAGQLPVSIPSGGTVAVGASKTFFMDTEDPSIPLDGSTYDAQLELAPYVFVSHRPEGGELVRLNSVDASPENYEYLSEIYHGEVEPYYLNQPVGVYTDYDNGAIYVLDGSWVGEPIYSEVTVVIRLTNFPPATDGSEATVSELYTVDPVQFVRYAQQLVVLEDGSVVLYDTYLYWPGEFRLVRLPQSLDFSSAQIGTVFPGPNPPEYDAMGLSQLPDGSFLVTGGDHSTIFAVTLDGVDDTTTQDFGTFTYGTGTNNLAYPTRSALSQDGTYVYISDTGYRFSVTPPPDDNSRIVRVDTNGSGFTSYGGPGTGTGRFDNPVILGLLPDNRLYIMDVGNSRLVRINPGVFDGGSAEWTQSDASANFTFDYWYNYS